MSIDYYRKGRTYELFIRKVFNCERGRRHGAERDLMINLFFNKLGKEDLKPHVPYARQFYKVKQYIEYALLKLKKRKKYIDSYNHFSPLLFKLRNATTANDLMKTVNQSFAKIIELENELKRKRIKNVTVNKVAKFY